MNPESREDILIVVIERLRFVQQLSKSPVRIGQGPKIKETHLQDAAFDGILEIKFVYIDPSV